jgi:hypothetical protein
MLDNERNLAPVKIEVRQISSSESSSSVRDWDSGENNEVEK